MLHTRLRTRMAQGACAENLAFPHQWAQAVKEAPLGPLQQPLVWQECMSVVLVEAQGALLLVLETGITLLPSQPVLR